MSVSIDYISTADVPLETRQAVLRAAVRANAAHEWWMEPICFMCDSRCPDRLSGWSKLYGGRIQLPNGEELKVGYLEDNLMTHRDVTYILSQLASWSAQFGLSWEISVEGDVVGQVTAEGPDTACVQHFDDYLERTEAADREDRTEFLLQYCWRASSAEEAQESAGYVTPRSQPAPKPPVPQHKGSEENLPEQAAPSDQRDTGDERDTIPRRNACHASKTDGSNRIRLRTPLEAKVVAILAFLIAGVFAMAALAPLGLLNAPKLVGHPAKAMLFASLSIPLAIVGYGVWRMRRWSVAVVFAAVLVIALSVTVDSIRSGAYRQILHALILIVVAGGWSARMLAHGAEE